MGKCLMKLDRGTQNVGRWPRTMSIDARWTRLFPSRWMSRSLLRDLVRLEFDPPVVDFAISTAPWLLPGVSLFEDSQFN